MNSNNNKKNPYVQGTKKWEQDIREIPIYRLPNYMRSTAA